MAVRKKTFFTVGPSEIYPTIPKHLLRAVSTNILSISHRGQEFKKIFEDTTLNLKKLLDIPKEYEIYFVSSALECMERIIQNTVEKVSFHVNTGAFGRTWFKIALELGKKPLKIDTKEGEGLDLSTLRVPKEVELICITQNDTSLGVALPEQEIHALKLHYPKKLIAVDIVSSVPYVDLDYSKVDIAFFSVQKGFGLPAGLGVLIVSAKAREKSASLLRKGISIGSFRSFFNLSEKAKEFATPETPNVLNIYLLNEVLKDMLKKGISKIRKETEEKANLLYKFFQNHPEFEPFIKNKKYYSKTTIVIDVKGKSKQIREKLLKKGILVGSGYRDFKEEHIRIGNFPSHKLSDIKKLLNLIHT